MKRRVLSILAITLIVLLLVCAFSFSVSAEEATTPTVSIDKFNLVFEDNVYLKYAVRFGGVDDSYINENNIGMLYFSAPSEDYTAGNEDYSSVVVGYTTIDGQKYYTFEYRHITAKQMTDYIYSVAYIDVDGERYYSAPNKFSVLEYCYSKLGKTGVASDNEDYRNLLSATLEQGAMAQKYFKYNTDRLANAEYYLIEVVGGTLEDGFTKGLYQSGDTATLIAQETSGNSTLKGWLKEFTSKFVSTSNPFIVNSFTKNEKYIACYNEIIYSEGLEFTSNGDGTCYVSGIGTCTDTIVVIPPDSPEGDRVTSIGNKSFYNCNLITEVVIPETITKINSYAFAGCENITHFNSNTEGELIVPNGVTVIGDYAFQGLEHMTKIVVPDSVTSIGNGAFKGCDSLEDITLPFVGQSPTATYGSSLFGYIFGYEESLHSAIAGTTCQYAYQGGYYNYWFCWCYYIPKTIKSVTITSQTTIPDYAFRMCDFIESIVLSNNVESIGKEAFYNCGALTEINLGTCLTTIGESAFASCASLESITMPDSVESIGKSAFSGSLKRLNSDIDGVIVLPTNLKVISSYMFSECTGITKVVVGNITEIQAYAFSGCNNIRSINNNIEGELIIPSGVTVIGDYAFQGLEHMTKIVVPDSVTSIGNGAFKGCDSLEDITLPFVGQSPTATYGSSLFGYIFGYEESLHSEIDGTICQYAYQGGYYNYWFCWCYYIPKTIKSVTITSQTTIPDYAFRMCDFIESIVLPNNVESIGKEAFYNCGALTEINLGPSLAFLGDYAFSGCKSLSRVNSNEDGKVVIPTGVAIIPQYAFQDCGEFRDVSVGNITDIQAYAFSGCNNIRSINNNIEGELIIPSGVTVIGDYAFQGLEHMTKIVVPDSVTSIGDGAFKGCESVVDITLPFVGSSATATSIVSSGFGYIFGSKSGTGFTISSGAILHYTEYYSTGYTYRVYYYIPESIRNVTITSQTSIPNYAFNNCNFIESIVLPTNVTSIGNYAFSGCTSLKRINSSDDGNVVLPTSVSIIPQYAFHNCVEFETVSVGNITEIRAYAFSGCNNIRSFNSNVSGELIIPNGVTNIEEYAFRDLEHITKVVVPDTVTAIGACAFIGCNSIEDITLPFVGNSHTVTEKYSVFGHIFGYTTYSSDKLSIEGAVYQNSEWHYPTDYYFYYYIPKTIRNVTITSQTAIPNYAFRNCSFIETITVKSNTSFGIDALSNCNATIKYF